VSIEAGRQEQARRLLEEKLRNAVHLELIIAQAQPTHGSGELAFKQLIRSKLKTKEEQVVFEAAYYYDLPPRDIQSQWPDLFPDAPSVYRIKENLLKRLRRDEDLRAYLIGAQEARAEDGGKSPT
jgi:hypothetical protein